MKTAKWLLPALIASGCLLSFGIHSAQAADPFGSFISGITSGIGSGIGGTKSGDGAPNKNDSVEGMQERRYSYLNSAEGAGARASTQPGYGYGGTDIRDAKGAAMPGMITGARLNGTLYSEIPMTPLATINFPVASRAQESEMYAHCPPLTGYHLTDSADYINTAIANDVLLGKLSDPERWVNVAKATQQAQNTQMGNVLAELTRNQANSAIDFCSTYLTNFTTSKQWNNVRDRLFIPIAILLLLPGAMLSQVKAIVAAGNPVLESTQPFEGILRSIIAIFLIPATCLVLNYGIDVSNSLTYTIKTEYQNIFQDDMYQSAICAEVRAFPVRQEAENRGALDQPTTKMGQLLPEAKTVFAKVEGQLFSTKLEDPCSGLYIAPKDRADESLPTTVVAARLAFNGINAALACGWNALCAFQVVYLHYLWLMGPIVAALWVWPLKMFRDALPSWIEGCVTLCLWSLLWNTTILLMACFRGYDETGTIMTTALNTLATLCVKCAFDFVGLVSQAGAQAAKVGQAMSSSLGQKGGGGEGGGQGSRNMNGHTPSAVPGASVHGMSIPGAAGTHGEVHSPSMSGAGGSGLPGGSSMEAGQLSSLTNAGGELSTAIAMNDKGSFVTLSDIVPPPEGKLAGFGSDASSILNTVDSMSAGLPPLSGMDAGVLNSAINSDVFNSSDVLANSALSNSVFNSADVLNSSNSSMLNNSELTNSSILNSAVTNGDVLNQVSSSFEQNGLTAAFHGAPPFSFENSAFHSSNGNNGINSSLDVVSNMLHANSNNISSSISSTMNVGGSVDVINAAKDVAAGAPPSVDLGLNLDVDTDLSQLNMGADIDIAEGSVVADSDFSVDMNGVDITSQTTIDESSVVGGNALNASTSNSVNSNIGGSNGPTILGDSPNSLTSNNVQNAIQNALAGDVVGGASILNGGNVLNAGSGSNVVQALAASSGNIANSMSVVDTSISSVTGNIANSMNIDTSISSVAGNIANSMNIDTSVSSVAGNIANNLVSSVSNATENSMNVGNVANNVGNAVQASVAESFRNDVVQRDAQMQQQNSQTQQQTAQQYQQTVDYSSQSSINATNAVSALNFDQQQQHQYQQQSVQQTGYQQTDNSQSVYAQNAYTQQNSGQESAFQQSAPPQVHTSSVDSSPSVASNVGNAVQSSIAESFRSDVVQRDPQMQQQSYSSQGSINATNAISALNNDQGQPSTRTAATNYDQGQPSTRTAATNYDSNQPSSVVQALAPSSGNAYQRTESVSVGGSTGSVASNVGSAAQSSIAESFRNDVVQRDPQTQQQFQQSYPSQGSINATSAVSALNLDQQQQSQLQPQQSVAYQSSLSPQYSSASAQYVEQQQPQPQQQYSYQQTTSGGTQYVDQQQQPTYRQQEQPTQQQQQTYQQQSSVQQQEVQSQQQQQTYQQQPAYQQQETQLQQQQQSSQTAYQQQEQTFQQQGHSMPPLTSSDAGANVIASGGDGGGGYTELARHTLADSNVIQFPGAPPLTGGTGGAHEAGPAAAFTPDVVVIPTPSFSARTPASLQDVVKQSLGAKDADGKPDAKQSKAELQSPSPKGAQSRLSSALRGAGVPLPGMDKKDAPPAGQKQTTSQFDFSEAPTPPPPTTSAVNPMDIAAGSIRNKSRMVKKMTAEELAQLEESANGWLL